MLQVAEGTGNSLTNSSEGLKKHKLVRGFPVPSDAFATDIGVDPDLIGTRRFFCQIPGVLYIYLKIPSVSFKGKNMQREEKKREKGREKEGKCNRKRKKGERKREIRK